MESMRRYQTLLDPASLPALLERCKGQRFVAFDTETTGLNPWEEGFKLVGISVAVSQHEGFYIPVGHENFAGLDYQPPNVDSEVVREFILDLFTETKVVMHNAAYDRMVLNVTMGIDLDLMPYEDTMLALHLYNENHEKSLKEWSKTLLGIDERDFDLTGTLEANIKKALIQEHITSVPTPNKNGKMYNKKVKTYTLRPEWLDNLMAIWRGLHNGAVKFGFIIKMTAKIMAILKKAGIVDFPGTFPTDFRYVPVCYGGEYASDDVMNTYGLWEFVETFLANNPKLKDLYYNIEQPVNAIMTAATVRGLRTDLGHLQATKQVIGDRVKEGFAEALDLATQLIPAEKWQDGSFNADTLLGSSKQLSALLYDILGFPVLELTDKKAPSVAKTALEKLKLAVPAKAPGLTTEARRFVDAKLRLGKLEKLASTYTDSIREKLDKNGRVHPSYNTVGTVSGRMSSNSPNFQNMPRLLPEEVADMPWLQGIDIRGAFRADPGQVFVMADFNAMEMVVCAALSGDDAMKELLNTGRDLHCHTAKYAFKVDQDMDDKTFKKKHKDLRQKAKIVNFALIYAGTEYTLVRNFGFAENEARQLVAGYFEAYPKVGDWIANVNAELTQKGYVEYPDFGFIKHLDLPENYNPKNRDHWRQFHGALRSSQNALIQGYSAYVVKEAIVKMTDRFRSAGLEAQVMIQIHDEVGVSCPVHEAPVVSEIMLECMQRTLNGVLLKAEPELKLTLSKAEEPVAFADLI
ncbi:MAG: DNA polymerase [Meiothermus sp.]|nr:DNA polymerase [Meiothermus sp.]